MKFSTIFTTSCLALLPAASYCQGTPTTGNSPITTALFDIEPTTPLLKERAVQITAQLLAELSNQSNLWLVERSQLDASLGELSLSASGMVNPDSAAQVGRLTGAKVLILGRALGSANETTIVAKVMGTETSRVYAVTETVRPGSEGAAARELAEKLSKTIGTHSEDFFTKTEDAGTRQARLRPLVSGKQLPTATVSIPEQHLTRPVRDPAAETEIASIMGRLGFTLLDASHADKAAIRVTGEAVSELGTRHGDFISCRARVEIKVVDVSTGKIILQDRQTEVAADISEAVAAKNALAKAGGVLAERIITAVAGPMH